MLKVLGFGLRVIRLTGLEFGGSVGLNFRGGLIRPLFCAFGKGSVVF